MLDMVLNIAISNGDAKKIELGEVDDSLFERLNANNEKIREAEESGDISDEQVKELENEFDSVWKDIADSVGADLNVSMLNVNSKTKKVFEIVAVDNMFYGMLKNNGGTIRHIDEIDQEELH